MNHYKGNRRGQRNFKNSGGRFKKRHDPPPPRPEAAAPKYLQLSKNRQFAPPGHSYKLYMEFWSPEKDWQRSNDAYKGNRNRKKTTISDCLKQCAELPNEAYKLLQSIRDRQRAMRQSLDVEVYHVSARTSSPFVTGMGYEHPLENGFHFSDPYGLPCLPGSSIKGVVKDTAAELALFDRESKWDLYSYYLLFGFDDGVPFLDSTGKGNTVTQSWIRAYDEYIENLSCTEIEKLFSTVFASFKDQYPTAEAKVEFLRQDLPAAKKSNVHWAGTLHFWDSYPELPKQTGMKVEIMNPHFGEYYQDSKAPHDGLNPTPINYLSVPTNQRMDFHVSLDQRLAENSELEKTWMALIDEAFSHVFEWSGFGAKRSQGFGTMQREESSP